MILLYDDVTLKLTEADLARQGHVDFAWEVSRSLFACQGAILLVDASQGIEAQTLSVYHIARERGLTIIPVLNKVPRLAALVNAGSHRSQIDLPAADPESVAAQMQTTFGVEPADVLRVSAKSGLGVDAVLEAIVSRIPAPTGNLDVPLRALLFDSS